MKDILCAVRCQRSRRTKSRGKRNIISGKYRGQTLTRNETQTRTASGRLQCTSAPRTNSDGPDKNFPVFSLIIPFSRLFPTNKAPRLLPSSLPGRAGTLQSNANTRQSSGYNNDWISIRRSFDDRLTRERLARCTAYQRRRRFRIDTEVRCVGAHPPFLPLEPARVKPK